MKYFLFLSTALFLFSCQKEDVEISKEYHYISEGFKSSYLFSPDSYWIYEDDSSDIDSVVLAHVEGSFFPDFCRKDYCKTRRMRQFYFMEFKNITLGVWHNYLLISNNIKINGSPHNERNGQPIYMHTRPIGFTFNGAGIEEKFDTFQLGENVFMNVTRVRISAANQYQPVYEFDTDLYFADGVGIIRKVVFDTLGTKTSDLVRYNVIPY